jgi:hypothetical protein
MSNDANAVVPEPTREVFDYPLIIEFIDVQLDHVFPDMISCPAGRPRRS